MNPDKIRKVYAPYSTTGEQVGQTPLEGYVDVAQAIYPAVNTGQIGKDGEWTGVTTSDRTFNIDTTHPAIANTGDVLVPQKQPDFINMTGYKDMFIALLVSNGGNYAITSVMGPETNPFSNLTPVAAARSLKGTRAEGQLFSDLLVDTAEDCQTDLWNIFFIGGNLRGQKNLQFKITNNSGGISNITFAYMRLA